MLPNVDYPLHPHQPSPPPHPLKVGGKNLTAPSAPKVKRTYTEMEDRTEGI